MSVVSNVIFTFDDCEEFDGEFNYLIMEQINKWLINNHYGPFGKDADAISGGTKFLETPIYVAAFNHFDEMKFMEYIKTLPWEDPESVQMIIKPPDGKRFEVVDFKTHAQRCKNMKEF